MIVPKFAIIIILYICPLFTIKRRKNYKIL